MQHDNSKYLLRITIIFYGLVFFIPLLFIFYYAIADRTSNFVDVFRQIFHRSIYFDVLLNTILISLLVTFLTFIISYPIVYLIIHSNGITRRLLLGLIISSMWINILVRSFAWSILLQRNGLINSVLMSGGIIEEPTSFLSSRFAVIIGMSNILIPMMVFSLLSSIKSKVSGLERVAYSLGASNFFYFFKVFLPQSKTGILAGCMLVFLLSMGFYITPALLGGGQSQTMMFSLLIEQQVNVLGNWQMASIISILLICSITLLLFLFFLHKPMRNHLKKLFSNNLHFE